MRGHRAEVGQDEDDQDGEGQTGDNSYILLLGKKKEGDEPKMRKKPAIIPAMRCLEGSTTLGAYIMAIPLR